MGRPGRHPRAALGVLRVPELSADALTAWLRDFAARVAEHADELTELDRLIGDADHGTNLARGTAAVAALDPGACASARDYAKRAALTLVSTVGGASGALYGTFLLRLAPALPDDGPIAREQWAAALRAGVAGVMERGRAEPGDKTMVDVLLPALEAFQAAPEASTGWPEAAAAAAEARDATADLVARRGRASYLGERSRGTVDPGAASATLLVEAAVRQLG